VGATEADSAPVGATEAGAATVADTPAAEAAADEEPVAPATALPTPTAATPADLVAMPTEDSQVAQNTPPRAVVLAADAFDLKTYLREVGRPDLALLPVRAQMQDGKLILRGMVTLDIHRRELLETVAQAPGIDDINAVDLLLRPQPTYTVQEGDTLWTIVYDIYGNVDRLDEFFEFNRDVLPSPDAVSVGLVLKVPPQE
jgi:nucleoid-associated protein YgaU